MLRVGQKCYKLMHMSHNHSEYFLSATGEKSIRAIADTAGLDQSTVNRQLSGITALRVETVVAICRSYGLDIAATMAAVGFITQQEATTFNSRFDLSRISDLELSKEMLRRVAAGTASRNITEPISEDVINDVLREVDNARETGTQTDYDLAANDDDTTPDQEAHTP